MVSRLTEAVDSQSRALNALESEVEQLSTREVAFERFDKEKWRAISKPACGAYSNKGIGPIKGKSSCVEACYDAEGLHGAAYTGTGADARCTCKATRFSQVQWLTICASSNRVLPLVFTIGLVLTSLRL